MISAKEAYEICKNNRPRYNIIHAYKYGEYYFFETKEKRLGGIFTVDKNGLFKEINPICKENLGFGQNAKKNMVINLRC